MAGARGEVARLEDTILRHLLPKDDEDHGGVILEVRGVGLGLGLGSKEEAGRGEGRGGAAGGHHIEAPPAEG